MPGRRIAICTFGSAGDLFPLIPIAQELERRGHDVHFLVPRSLGLYLRLIGVRSVALGRASEMAVFDDPLVLSTRRDGWRSIRHTVVTYIAPTIEEHIADAHRALDVVSPDLVVTASYAVGCRIVAYERELPHVSITIYPHLTSISDSAAKSFAKPFVRAIRSVASDAVLRDYGLASIMWGANRSGLGLHDPAVIGFDRDPGLELLGYPYWDELPVGAADLDETTAWIRRAPDRTVVVSMGSFVGRLRGDGAGSMVSQLASAGCRVLVINAPADVRDASPDIRWTGFLPYSTVVHECAATVHHGGLGTSFGALHAAVPAVVIPQAWDQPRNARLLVAAGCAVQADSDGIVAAVMQLLTDTEFRCQTSLMASRLISPQRAASHAARQILAQN